jgi:hypothetical protein
MDPMLAAALAVLAATLAIYFFFLREGGGSAKSASAAAALPPSAAQQRAALQARGAVLLCGPPSSGKTTLLHQLLFGAAVRTVPSSQVQAIQAPLHHEPAAPPRSLVDCPGAARFRSQLLRFARECSAGLVVVGAAGGAEQVRGAAAALYDLYTDAAVVARAPRVLVVGSRADEAGPEPLPALRQALERELQRLKATRSSSSSASAGGGGEALLLGAPGADFTFEREAPWAPPEWVTAVAVGAGAADAAPGLQGVRRFLSAL